MKQDNGKKSEFRAKDDKSSQLWFPLLLKTKKKQQQQQKTTFPLLKKKQLDSAAGMGLCM